MRLTSADKDKHPLQKQKKNEFNTKPFQMHPGRVIYFLDIFRINELFSNQKIPENRANQTDKIGTR